MPYVTSDGANIYLETAGNGPPVLFLHGFGMDHRQWDPQWDALTASQQGFRMDLRGHGRSATTVAGYTFGAMAQDVQRVMVQVGMDRRNPGFLVAHSLSGDAALQAALDESRALRGVVLAAPAIRGQDWSPDWQAMWRAVGEDVRAGRRAEGLARFLEDPIFDGVRSQAELLELVRSMQAACAGAHAAADERDHGTPTRERLAACKVPVLLLWGARDREQFRAVAHEIASRVPGAEAHEIADAGHVPNLEAPAAFTSRVLDFLSRH